MMNQTMRSCGAIIAVVVGAGCMESADTGLLPGVELDGAPRAVSAITRDEPKPCGTLSKMVFPDIGFEQTTRSRITYDRAGLEVLRVGVSEDTGEEEYRYTIEWNHRGQLVQAHNEFAGGVNYHYWYTYDRFDRLVRTATDEDGDGAEDSVLVYAYRRDGLRATSQLTSTRSGNYLQHYFYDENRRLIRTERDLGLDGTIDQVTTFEYDDEMRQSAVTATDAAGVIITHSTVSYDARDRVTSRIRHDFEAGETILQEEHYRYARDRLIQDTYTFARIADGSEPVILTDGTTDYFYGRCR